MTFQEVTSELLKCFTAAQIAEAIGCSVSAVKQARLSPDKPGHRPPPDGWRESLRELARSGGDSLHSLSDRI